MGAGNLEPGFCYHELGSFPGLQNFLMRQAVMPRKCFFSVSRKGANQHLGGRVNVRAVLPTHKPARGRSKRETGVKPPAPQGNSTEIGCQGFRCHIRSALPEAWHRLSFDVVSKKTVHTYLKGC